MTEKAAARDIRVNGIVQGVGFRPFIYQLAETFAITGTVANTSSGVVIHAQGTAENLSRFREAIETQAPPLSRIRSVTEAEETPGDYPDFRIVRSETESKANTLISPDMAVCEDCLKEMRDPEDRRYRYPFINCTNCGPRYTIIDDIPYDRPFTSMRHFKMCESCQSEYDDPKDRRFHAQPNACPVCGPHVSLFDNDRQPVTGDDPVRETVRLLKAGKILAIKGLGGFHLAADAENESAVRLLRERKGREEKPFALMSADLNTIRTFAEISPEEEALLTSQQRPIVLLEKKTPEQLASSVSPHNRYYGVMLPYTPLHHLFFSFDDFPFSALVMTSGNLSEEPIAIDNEDAFSRLGNLADYLLIHNRDIYLRSDDSITFHAGGATRFIRRSRGYAPMPVFLREKGPSVLACGGGLKSTVCLTRGDAAILSQHIGDMENLETYEFFRLTIGHLKRILDVTPEIITYDLHPDYMSTRYALEETRGEKIAVQHHHAHIAACLGEHQIEGPVIGLAFDGTGYGTDGTIWGGEILIADERDFTRPAHLETVAMPGGEKAIREPWRMAVSYLHECFGEEMFNRAPAFLEAAGIQQAKLMTQMIRKGLNAPQTSSLGRLFDAVAALLGVRHRVNFEGQAAMELEMTAAKGDFGRYDYEWSGTEPKRVLSAPLISGVLNDLDNGVSKAVIAARFHATLIRLFTDLCKEIRSETGLNRTALSGGVFQNRTLLEGMIRALSAENFEVFTHTQVPTNDGGISLGQAVVAMGRC